MNVMPYARESSRELSRELSPVPSSIATMRYGNSGIKCCMCIKCPFDINIMSIWRNICIMFGDTKSNDLRGIFIMQIDLYENYGWGCFVFTHWCAQKRYSKNNVIEPSTSSFFRAQNRNHSPNQSSGIQNHGVLPSVRGWPFGENIWALGTLIHTCGHSI